MRDDHVLEEIVTKKNKNLSTLNYILLTILMVVFGLFASFFLAQVTGRIGQPFTSLSLVNLLCLVVFGGLTWFCFVGRRAQRVEYEYSFTNGTVDIARVISNNTRKELLSFRMRDIEVLTAVHSDEFNRYSKTKEIKKIHAVLNKLHPHYFAVVKKQEGRVMVVMEPSEALLRMMKLYNQHAVKVSVLSRSQAEELDT